IALDAAGRQRRDRELGRRVGAVVGEAPQGPDALVLAHGWMPAPLTAVGERLAHASGLRGWLEARLERAAVPMRPGEFVMIVVGGNLAEILENVADTVRERARIRRQVKVLSGEGRLSVAVLIGLPFVLGLGLELLNPGYINVLFTDPIGWLMLGAAGLLMLVG